VQSGLENLNDIDLEEGPDHHGVGAGHRSQALVPRGDQTQRWLMLSQMTLQRVSDSSGMDTDKKAHSHQSCAATLMTATHNQEKVRPATDQANRNNAPGT
jgi:hypothetical protein